MKKLAVFFPGIGYSNDRALLYYSRVIAKQYNFEIVQVNYTGFPDNILGDHEKKKQCFLTAMEQTEKILSGIDFSQYEDIVFISKSIGTIVAGAYASIHDIPTRNIYFTPVIETFDYIFNKGISFFGNDDPWIDEKEIIKKCNEKDITYILMDECNHSLETGDVESDLTRLKNIMVKVERYIGDYDE